MAATYDLIKDFQTADAVLSTNPHWIIAVWSFKKQALYSRDLKRSSSNDPTETVETGEPLIITSDCTRVTTASQKTSHLSTMQATLLPGQKRYMNEIFPGDWMAVWIMHDQFTFNDVLDRLRKQEPCNGFDDGLKFLGRVQSLRENVTVDRGTGTRHTSYALTGIGFQELDSFIFYDPLLTHLVPNFSQWMGELNIAINDFLSTDGIDINKAIPLLFEILLGKGISKQFANPGGDPTLQAVSGSTGGTGEADYAYLVPSPIGSTMGRKSRGKPHGILAYADLLEVVIGLQRYAQGEKAGDVTGYKVFVPDNIKTLSGTVKKAGADLLGLFVPQIPTFTNQTIWTILNQFLNPAVNEMYTCLRVNDEGVVVPQLVVRQLPFSTKFKTDSDSALTPYLELPRWKIDDTLVHGYDIGRSDAMRTNFVHLTGQGQMMMPQNQMVYQIARDGTFRDEQDIKRSGLRMDNQTVACSNDDGVKGPKRWMEIRSDIVMGQHLTLTGTFQLVGIAAPICEGDNIEYDGVIYHIESVTHEAFIDPMGMKGFVTTVSVTHGMRDNPEVGVPFVDNGDGALYVGVTDKPGFNHISTEDVNV